MPFEFWNWQTPEAKQASDAERFQRESEQKANQADANLFASRGTGILDSFYQMADDLYSKTQPIVDDWQSKARQDAEDFGSMAMERLSKIGADPAPAPDAYKSEDLGGYTNPDLMAQPNRVTEQGPEGGWTSSDLQAQPDRSVMSMRGQPMGDIAYRPDAETNTMGQTVPMKTSAQPPPVAGAGSSALLDAWNAFQGKAGEAGTSLQQGLGEANQAAIGALNDRADQIGQGIGRAGEAYAKGWDGASAPDDASLPERAANLIGSGGGALSRGREEVDANTRRFGELVTMQRNDPEQWRANPEFEKEMVGLGSTLGQNLQMGNIETGALDAAGKVTKIPWGKAMQGAGAAAKKVADDLAEKLPKDVPTLPESLPEAPGATDAGMGGKPPTEPPAPPLGESLPEPDPGKGAEWSIPGTGRWDEAIGTDAAEAVQRVAQTGKQFDSVPMDSEIDVAAALGLKPEEVAKKFKEIDTRQGAAEVESLKVAATKRVTDFNEVLDDVRSREALSDQDKQRLIDRFTDVLEMSESIKGLRRAGEYFGRGLRQFGHAVVAKSARAEMERLQTAADAAQSAMTVLEEIQAGNGVSTTGRNILTRAADALDGAAAKDSLGKGGASESFGKRLGQVKDGKYVDPLAEEMKGMEAKNKEIDAFLAELQQRTERLTDPDWFKKQIAKQKNFTPEQADDFIKKLDERTRARFEAQAVKTKMDEVRGIVKEIIADPNDPKLREKYTAWYDEMLGNKQARQQAETMLQSRLDGWAKKFAGDVEKRNTAAEVAERGQRLKFMDDVEGRNQAAAEKQRKALEREDIKDLAAKLREMATLAAKNRNDPRLLDGIEELRYRLNDVNLEGAARAQDLSKSLTTSGLVHLARRGKLDDAQIDDFVNLLKTVDTSDPASLGRVMNLIRQPNGWDKLKEFSLINMLSSWATWGVTGVNTANNLGTTTAHLGFKLPVSSAADAVLAKIEGRAPALSASEIPAAWAAANKAWRPALDIWLEVMKTGTTKGAMERAVQLGDFGGIQHEALSQGRFGWLGALGHMLSTRGLEASDQAMGHILYSSELARLAERKAAKTGTTADQILANLGDHMDIVDQAGKVRDYTLLRGEADAINRALSAARYARPDATQGQQAVAMMAHQLLPFVNTPYNWFKQGIEFSPMGTVANVARMAGEKDPARKAELASNIAAGAVIAFVGTKLWQEGNLTGSGPDDPTERREWFARGYQPRSVKVNGTWVSYDSTPFAIAFTMIAEAADSFNDAVKNGEKRGTVSDWNSALAAGMGGAVKGVGSGLINQSFMRGVGDIIATMRDTGGNSGAVAANQVSRYIPMSGMLGFLARAGDQVMRDPKVFEEYLQQNIPGQRQNVPVRTNVMGQPVPNTQAGAARAVFPFPRASVEQAAPELDEYKRLGLTFPVVGNTINGERLSRPDEIKYHDTAQTLRNQLATQLMATPMYRQANDAEKTRLLKGATDRAQAWAAQSIKPGETDARGNVRTGTEWLALKGDPNKAISGYLSALDTDQQLAKLRDSRYLGVSGEDSDQIAKDRALISAYHSALGESSGDLKAMQEMGASRYYKARFVKSSPMYERQRQRLTRDPNYALFFSTGPDVMTIRRPSALDLEPALT